MEEKNIRGLSFNCDSKKCKWHKFQDKKEYILENDKEEDGETKESIFYMSLCTSNKSNNK